MKKHESFNRSDFSKFLNSPKGRLFRLANGLAFLAIGMGKRQKSAGKFSMIFGFLPLSAAILDICYVSALLGGPISGKQIRLLQSEAAPVI